MSLQLNKIKELARIAGEANILTLKATLLELVQEIINWMEQQEKESGKK